MSSAYAGISSPFDIKVFYGILRYPRSGFLNKTPRIDRKELRSPDQFVKRGSSLLTFLVTKRSSFFVVATVGAVATILFYGYDYWNSRRVLSGWQSFNKAEKLEESKRWEGMKNVYTLHSGVRPGFMAAVRIADHLFESARKDLSRDKTKAKASATESAEWYAKAKKFSDLLPTEKQLLAINYGGALEIAEQLDVAISEYKVASETAGDATAFALLKLASAFETKGDATQAEQAYQKVSSDFPSTEFSKMAKNGLRRMRSPFLKQKAS